jgi:hypothetical protein
MTSARTALSTAAALLLATAGALTSAPTAHAADPALLTCTGSNRADYSPGLTLTSQPVSVKDEALSGECLNSDQTANTTYKTAYWNETAAQNLSCVLPASTRSGTRDINWNFGSPATSVFTYSLTTTVLAGQIVETYTGTITSGSFTGVNAKIVVVLTAPGVGNCLLTPLTTASGQAILEIGI